MEVVRHVEDIIDTRENDKVPVFKIHDLKTLYIKKMILYGASAEDVSNVHVTRFKERILEHIPSLVENKEGKFI